MATAPDYSLIWAQNSPLSPYNFSSADYLTGWNFIGAIPPDRRMFDAWMSKADTKQKWLYDNTAKKSDLDDLRSFVKANGGVPVGTIISYAGNGDVDGFLLCDGSPVSRTTYKDLFDVIGTLYGGGDGSTTFNLPNLADKFLEGSDTAGTNVAAGLPNIEGKFALFNGNGMDTLNPVAGASDLFYFSHGANSSTIANTSPPTPRDIYSLDASRVSPVYGKSNTVQPPAVTIRFLIKATGASATGGGMATDADVEDMLDGVFG